MNPTATFEFNTAGRIIFGAGRHAQLPELAATIGARPLLVTGSHPDRYARTSAALNGGSGPTLLRTFAGEPAIAAIMDAAAAARAADCDSVVAIGGGSVLDAGKAIAAFLTNPGDPFDHLEVVGRVLAAPTTAGTGSEVTRNAVVGVPERRVKVSLRHPSMLPRIALVDPELTHSQPPAVTAAAGLDALTQVLEAFVSRRANPLTDALCRAGMAHAAAGLLPAYHDGSDAAARHAMTLCSLFGGLALSNAGLGAVHGFANPLGGRIDAPHGAICACLLPWVMEANIRALRARQPQSPSLARYDEVARILTGDPQAHAAAAVAWVRAAVAAMAIPPLGAYGFSAADIPESVQAARRASSMQANPVELTDRELAAILEHAA
jgi:alcohol dehydrogenase class IV